MSERIQRLMMDICPWRLGQRVRVKEAHEYAADWRGTFVIVGLTWQYQRGDGRVNIALASDDEIVRGYGSTDGFGVDDLEPEPPAVSTHAYVPHPQHPWFCRDCGYSEHERLKHPEPAAPRPALRLPKET